MCSQESAKNSTLSRRRVERRRLHAPPRRETRCASRVCRSWKRRSAAAAWRRSNASQVSGISRAVQDRQLLARLLTLVTPLPDPCRLWAGNVGQSPPCESSGHLGEAWQLLVNGFLELVTNRFETTRYVVTAGWTSNSLLHTGHADFPLQRHGDSGSRSAAGVSDILVRELADDFGADDVDHGI